jgi:hypothetical protein
MSVGNVKKAFQYPHSISAPHILPIGLRTTESHISYLILATASASCFRNSMIPPSTVVLQLIHPQELAYTACSRTGQPRGIRVVQASMTAKITCTGEGLHAVLAVMNKTRRTFHQGGANPGAIWGGRRVVLKGCLKARFMHIGTNCARFVASNRLEG